jgi:hypothetical protein
MMIRKSHKHVTIRLPLVLLRESPSSEAGMMGNINENGKSEQNNNGENIDQSGNGLDIKCGVCGKMFASSWQLHVHELS